MRLLKYEEDGELTITPFDDNAIPPYAILSHTWGADTEEVTFADLAKGGGQAKRGYQKIRFCGEQASRDGLEYFWIDTCCINKESNAELSLAINSMFRWYRNSARCYVYLSDVSSPPLDTSLECNLRASEILKTEWFTWVWIFLLIHPILRWCHSMIRRFFLLSEPSSPQSSTPELKESRWFTRGWTLQELLAPSRVEFFSKEHTRLGDTGSLTQQIHEITGIPREALQGVPLSQFSDKERFSWIEHRQTKIPEDKAYSLLGIFGIEMPLRYGEGAAGAFKRLEEEKSKLNNCLRDLSPGNPCDDKKRIEGMKGGLLADSYCWIRDNTTFQQWQTDSHNQLLWVKGDPGKGKTMLLCGIIDVLHDSTPKTTLLSYFFCQAPDSRINSATAVLRGLLFMLMDQQPSLVWHIRKKHDQAGKSMFEDRNAWVALTEIFADVLRDTSLSATYLIIDALDECVTDLPELLSFIAKQSSASSRVKWIVASRNWPAVEEKLGAAEHKTTLSLELNAESVAAAVKVFIQQKVCQLAQEKRYTPEVEEVVLQHLTSNANDTFLWVALVCQDLKETPKWLVLEKITLFPPGLDALYKRMLDQISESNSAKICQQVLASTTVLYRPVTIPELIALVQPLENLANDLESVREIVGLCGSFLTLRNDTVYFVHQSAKDFLLAKALNGVFPDRTEDIHQAIFSKSLAIQSRTLHRDMYSLKALGSPVEIVQAPKPDPLAASRYSCVYWIDHLCDSNPRFSATYAGCLQSSGTVDTFLREKYLYWLEALSLCGSMPKGVLSITKLQSLFQGKEHSDSVRALVNDAYRFLLYHKGAIESYPLQTYASALLFSPKGSLMRQLFRHEEPGGITIRPAMSNDWSTCLQTLEGHSDWVRSVAFSPDSSRLARLASASDDGTVKIWDASSGTCVQTLEGHYNIEDWMGFESQQRIHQGIGINLSGTWITHNAQELLWLPTEYRPQCSAVSGRCIGLGGLSGKVLICRVP
ncbi:HET-domain-containing protein [Didymella exigua CBS 183.55]|uniref:HET-domain-containing protein n=1 Tax=Didymella exigua CBS 183.55 TaxID=1150837 RepID=A0A6A5RZE0_9PLEO|nr:HET-domain-containing protein [Didymella exigua CBS 183.55]KAF1932604.1 HET-domain-containing protein [Didymella exigua CBS 183.55]